MSLETLTVKTASGIQQVEGEVLPAGTMLSKDNPADLDVLLMVDGTIAWMVMEAKTGPDGYAIKMRLDERGQPVVVDGAIALDMVHGNVVGFRRAAVDLAPVA